MEEFKVYRLGGKNGEELVNLVAIFYDLSLAEEFVDCDHSGLLSDYAIVHKDKVVYNSLEGCLV